MRWLKAKASHSGTFCEHRRNRSGEDAEHDALASGRESLRTSLSTHDAGDGHDFNTRLELGKKLGLEACVFLLLLRVPKEEMRRLGTQVTIAKNRAANNIKGE